jgi:hypothetical protein
LPSLKGAHEEEDHVRLAAVICQGDLVAGAAGQANVRRQVADAKVASIFSVQSLSPRTTKSYQCAHA